VFFFSCALAEQALWFFCAVGGAFWQKNKCACRALAFSTLCPTVLAMVSLRINPRGFSAVSQS